MATPAPGPLHLRVLCPDGLIAEEFTAGAGSDTERLARWARLAAANCDDLHDGARCDGPHRIEQATWTEIARDEEGA